MTKHFFSLIILSFVLVFQLKAQDEYTSTSITEKPKFERNKHILSLSLLSQLDFNSPSLQFGYDLKLAEVVGLHQELGLVNNWLNPFYSFIDNSYSGRIKNKIGVKYVIEPRFYPFHSKSLMASRIFFAPSFDFRYVYTFRNEWVSRMNFTYQEKMTYGVQRISYGGTLKFGFSTKLKKATPIDFVFGLGARYVTRTNNLPEDANLIFNGNNFLFSPSDISGNVVLPTASFGMFLHLPIQKKQ